MTNRISQKSKLYWACRRGMLELDLLLLPFFEARYDALSQDEKETFVRLLEMEDPILYQWFIAHQKPEDPKLNQLVEAIIAYKRAC